MVSNHFAQATAALGEPWPLLENAVHPERLSETLADLRVHPYELEPDGKGLPPLVKQYMKLGGQVMGLNEDPDFCDSLDGFIVVDLSKANPRQMKKFMGMRSDAQLGRCLA